jgi:hypothetical protein
MNTVYTLFFLILTTMVSAQNDSIYTNKSNYNKGELIELVFKLNNDSITLATDGACTARWVWATQTLKPTGWPDASGLFDHQMDCGLPYTTIKNGTYPLYTAGYAHTYRIVLITDKGYIFTSPFTVTD